MAKRAHVDVDAVAASAFGLVEDHGPFRAPPHVHAKHQILYAATGTMTLTVADRRWTLPPQRAAWIGAGTSHDVFSVTGIGLRTVYLAPSLVRGPLHPARVFAVTPLAREMILHAMRWGPETAASATREAFFTALAGLANEWIDAEQPYWLPQPRSPELARAVARIAENLAEATVEDAARAAHVSVRTLSRRFEEEMQLPFRRYLQIARIMRSLELLALPRASVTTTAYAVGFTSVAAFTTAFGERIGETPRDYRARVGPAR